MASNENNENDMIDQESQSILAPRKRKLNNPAEAKPTNAKQSRVESRNVVSLGGHRTGLAFCSCLQNIKTITYRYLLNQIPEENLEVFWQEVIELVNKHSK